MVTDTRASLTIMSVTSPTVSREDPVMGKWPLSQSESSFANFVSVWVGKETGLLNSNKMNSVTGHRGRDDL